LAAVFALAEVLFGFDFTGVFLVLATFLVVVELVFFSAEAFLVAGLGADFFVAVVLGADLETFFAATVLATGLAGEAFLLEEVLVLAALVVEAFFAVAGFALGLAAVLVLVAAGLDLALVEGFFVDLVVGIME
jgi:hypothetical protein